tara:strand:+ start:380 stop:607 length:228 start_codon:yes stop_codon:yes gene_type:complete
MIEELLNLRDDQLREKPFDDEESQEIILLFDHFIYSFVSNGFDIGDLPLSTIEYIYRLSKIIDQQPNNQQPTKEK